MGSGVEGGYRPDMSQAKPKAVDKETRRRPQIPETEISVKFVLAGGPGGQNVNKRKTKAEMRWVISAANSITEDEKALVRKELAHKIVGDEILLTCRDHRTQLENKKACMDKLHELVWEAIIPETERKATKMSRGQQAARLDSKTRDKRKKEERRRGNDE